MEKDSPFLSRRKALVAGAFAAPAAILAPAAGFATRARGAALPEGHAIFSIDGRTVLVDTRDTPPMRLEREECGVPGRTIDVAYYDFEPGAEYVALHWDGRLLVGPLVSGSAVSPMHIEKQRLGWLPPKQGPSYTYSERVTVLGKVIG